MAHFTVLSTRIPKLKPPTSEKLCFSGRFSPCFDHLAVSTCLSLSSQYQYNNKKKLTIANKCNVNLNPTTCTTASSVASSSSEKFDWYAQWYPIMPLCDLDKRKPTGKRVMGLDVVVWWDRIESQWKVFNDLCPHRLAPLSEGRIDHQGRLQCVYHGWCFNGSGHCKLIPQAPSDGPPVHTSKKACVTVYPSTVQNNIVWFWPNPDPEFKDILDKKKPPFLPHLDDPSYSNLFTTRDMNYGYEVLIENLMDPSHLPYAHYGVVKTPPPIIKVDREGGSPLNLGIKHMNINGFSTMDSGHFFAPCVFYFYHPVPPSDDGNGNGNGNGSVSASETGANKVPSSQLKHVLMFICVPVSPGKSRLLWSAPRNFGVWMDKIIPRWVFHLHQNLIIDSDLYILHVQEQKVMEYGPRNWQKICFVPTKADGIVSGYRKWLNKYSNGQVDWGSKFNRGALPPTPPREELLDRYWTHVVNCSSCHAAYKGLGIAETALQVISFGLIGVVAVTTFQRTSMFVMAILCFVASKWLSKFIYKNFHFHDYVHSVK